MIAKKWSHLSVSFINHAFICKTEWKEPMEKVATLKKSTCVIAKGVREGGREGGFTFLSVL